MRTNRRQIALVVVMVLLVLVLVLMMVLVVVVLVVVVVVQTSYGTAKFLFAIIFGRTNLRKSQS